MLVPASLYKDAIEKQFKAIQYTDKYLWYTGSIDNYDMEVKTEGDKFAFAITYEEQLIGYVSFRVDWFCSMAYNFSLIRFSDAFVEIGGVATRTITSAIREVIRMVEGFNLHRIDFRCVSGNPAEEGYDGIIERFHGKYKLRKIDFRDNIRDYKGKYHDTICYELIRRENENQG